MVVRFVPTDEPVVPRPERQETDLAEVIDFRSRLRPLADQPVQYDAEDHTESEADSAARHLTDSEGTVRRPPVKLTTADLRNISEPGQSKQVSERTSAHTKRLRVVSTDEAEMQLDAGGDTQSVRPSALLRSVAAQSGDELPTEEPAGSAYEDGVKVLARKAMSRGELSRDLMSRGHSSLEVEIVLDEFCERLYLDDTSLARTLAERLRDRKGASKGHIRQKLRERQLSDAVITVVLDELDDAEEYGLLLEAANDRARKMTGLDRATAERRLFGFLARRGWSGEHVQRAVREALDENGSSRSVRFR